MGTQDLQVPGRTRSQRRWCRLKSGRRSMLRSALSWWLGRSPTRAPAATPAVSLRSSRLDSDDGSVDEAPNSSETSSRERRVRAEDLALLDTTECTNTGESERDIARMWSDVTRTKSLAPPMHSHLHALILQLPDLPAPERPSLHQLQRMRRVRNRTQACARRGSGAPGADSLPCVQTAAIQQWH